MRHFQWPPHLTTCGQIYFPANLTEFLARILRFLKSPEVGMMQSIKTALEKFMTNRYEIGTTKMSTGTPSSPATPAPVTEYEFEKRATAIMIQYPNLIARFEKEIEKHEIGWIDPVSGTFVRDGKELGRIIERIRLVYAFDIRNADKLQKTAESIRLKELRSAAIEDGRKTYREYNTTQHHGPHAADKSTAEPAALDAPNSRPVAMQQAPDAIDIEPSSGFIPSSKLASGQQDQSPLNDNQRRANADGDGAAKAATASQEVGHPKRSAQDPKDGADVGVKKYATTTATVRFNHLQDRAVVDLAAHLEGQTFNYFLTMRATEVARAVVLAATHGQTITICTQRTGEQ